MKKIDFTSRLLSGGAVCAAAVIGSIGLAACGGSNAQLETPPPQMRFISEDQYRNSIADIFGEGVEVVGRFEAIPQKEHLAALGASEMSVSSRAYERYYALASSIATQAVSEDGWARIMPCDVPEGDAFDEACASNVISVVGGRLLRRELNETEIARWVTEIDASTAELGSFRQAVGLAIEGMLASPEFLFIIDETEPGPSGKGVRLTGLAKAHRLSFFLWDSVPDDELLTLAETGEIHDKKVLKNQVDRMIASERINTGAEAFFSDFLDLDRFDTLEKDKLIYPAFNKRAALDAREQVLKFLDHQLIAKEAPYTDIFTARDTFVTRPLGMLYQIPVTAREGWEPFTFPEGDPRAGLLSHIGFTALHSHPGRSSATLRGIAVRELILCQPVAPAPAAVNFTVVQDTENPDYKTARDRLTAHRTDPACTSCHEFIDPVGLALENFDGAGAFRETEHGAEIDLSGELDGAAYQTLPEMQQVVANHPAAPACLVDRLQKYALGREPIGSEKEWRKRLEQTFAKKGQSVPELFKAIATSEEFFAVGEPNAENEPLKEANMKKSEGGKL